jgi:hypothetical protein
MQIARYFTLVALAIIVILPIMAHRGKGYRGAWAVVMVVGMIVAVFSFRVLAVNMALFHSTLTDADLAEKFQKSRSEIDQTIVWSFVTFFCSAGFAIGSLLAVCIYRKEAHQAKSGRVG